MTIRTVSTQPYPGQRPGTSGLRKRVKTFMQPLYLENFVQALFDVLKEPQPGSKSLRGQILVLGGDGRYYNREAIQLILKLAAGNGVAKVVLGRSGWLSTPAVSAVIRKRQAVGGLILSASHNPGGLNADFGIKYNASNGGPAPEALTEAVYQRTQAMRQLHRSDAPDIDIDRLAVLHIEQMQVEVIDPIADYLELMRSQFDFEAIRGLFQRDFRILVDAMHAIGGPYARAILEGELGAAPGSVINAVPLADFGGLHPDPNPVHAASLVMQMTGTQVPDFGAAMDGDADRNMILGRGLVVSPSDSLAILTAHARLIPAFRDGLAGVARSMPTSTAVDRVAKALDIPCFETPTGWKFFGNLLDAGLVNLCGEESYGTGSSHVREKDGLWAILFWLNIQAVTGRSVDALVGQHWRTYGRTVYTRHDYENMPTDTAEQMLNGLRFFGSRLVGKAFGARKLVLADEYGYTDPVDGSVSQHQGMRFVFDDGARVVFRLSGTGTQGATLRIYMERHEPNPDRHRRPVALAMAELAAWARAVSGVPQRTGRQVPHVIS
jgi:phosphoglucomutase